MEKLAKSLGIENLSRSQASEMTKGLNSRGKPSGNVLWKSNCFL